METETGCFEKVHLSCFHGDGDRALSGESCFIPFLWRRSVLRKVFYPVSMAMECFENHIYPVSMESECFEKVLSCFHGDGVTAF